MFPSLWQTFIFSSSSISSITIIIIITQILEALR